MVSRRAPFNLRMNPEVAQEGTSDGAEKEDVPDSEVVDEDSPEEEEKEDEEEGEEGEEDGEEAEVVAAEVLTPLEEAIKAKEGDLVKELAALESQLKSERLNAGRSRDKVFESGKSGFFVVQAQVSEFLVRDLALA